MDVVLCLTCRKNPVPVGRWNLPCEECRAKKADDHEKKDISIHQRQPAAVIKPDDTENTNIFVDKHGKEVRNPGYDLENDPRGWKFTGKKPIRGTIIK